MALPFFSKRINNKQTESIAVSTGFDILSGRAYPALENSAFWNCITKLCRLYGTMPLHLYQRNGIYRSVVGSNNALSYLMKNPCKYMNAYRWRFVMGFNYELHGEAMAIITRKGNTIVSLDPVSPRLMMSVWKDNVLSWRYSVTGEEFSNDRVLRLTNLPIGYSEVLSPVDYAHTDLEVAKNSKILQTNYYKNGASIGGILSVPKGTSKEIKDQLRSAITSSYSGASNAHKTMVIEDSMKYEPIHLEEGDVVKLQTAQSWTVDEVARRFGVPPFFCGDLQKATYANSEQQGMDLVIYALQPRFTAWEETFNDFCKDDQYFKFNLNGLMRGDHTARSAFYHNGIMDGYLTENEVRNFEDMNPFEGGDVHYFPLNYGRINSDGSIEQPKSTTPAFNPFDLPADSKKEKVEKVEPIKDRRTRDLEFLEKTNNVTKTNRQKIESIMRSHINACTEKLKELVSKGYDLATIMVEFETYANSIQTSYGEQYVEVFKDVIGRLLPIIQKQIDSQKEVSQETLNAYAGKFGQMMSGRFTTNRVNETKACQDIEELEGVKEKWFEVPTEESQEETQRAGNAFQVFLYGELGLSYMHVVAAPDACEFCQNLDGKVVEVNGNILSKGDEAGDGHGNIRHINKNYKHPPFHRYCNCGIAPGEGK